MGRPTIPTGQFSFVGLLPFVGPTKVSMRLRDDNKRKHVTAVAAKLFASEPFHKVRLDDVAAAAGVGKGTLYVYFNSKEDLYFSIIADGFAEMVDRLKGPLSDSGMSALARIRTVVSELARSHFSIHNCSN